MQTVDCIADQFRRFTKAHDFRWRSPNRVADFGPCFSIRIDFLIQLRLFS
jgi:hypothetical protein